MVAPARSIFSFDSWDRDHPGERPPGDRLDAQFEELLRGQALILEQLNAVARSQQAVEALARHPVPLTAAPNALGYAAGGFYATDDGGAAATAADYAQVSIDWAEYMPWTIPPNTLAVNAITGDHWSSRWWANKAAMFYQALIDAAPHPLPASGHLPAISLYYVATPGQTSFPLWMPDRFALSYVLQPASQVKVARNGQRLMPDDGSGKGSYTVSQPGNEITLLWPAGVDEVITVDVWEPAISEAPLDGRIYGRQNGFWSPLPDEAPLDGQVYARQNGVWIPIDVSGADRASKERAASAPVLGYGAGGFYSGDAKGADATSADYAQVSIEWAEHLPDTIPPNILAINAITGDHWSSRWWANRAAILLSAMGNNGVAATAEPVAVLGANTLALLSSPPLDGPTTMEMIVNGRVFCGCAVPAPFTVSGKQIVWTSTLFGLSPGDEVIARYRYSADITPSMQTRAVSLYYVATQGQMDFPLNTPDRFSRVYTLGAKSIVQASRNGARLMPNDSAGKGGFVVAGDIVTLLWPAGLDETIVFDIWESA